MNYTEIKDLVGELVEEQAQVKTLEASIKEKRTLLKEELQRQQVDSTTMEIGDGVRATLTLVEPTSIVIDEVKLKRALGAPLWDKVTVKVLDADKLEAQIVSGVIDPVVVAKVSSEIELTKYVKVTLKTKAAKKPVQPARKTK